MTDDPLPLTGLTVLVTRPADQAGPLCERIAAAGGQPVALALQRIVACPPPVAASGAAATIWIFVSRNAVLHGLAGLRAALAAGNKPTVIAIGQATAATLRAAGVRCLAGTGRASSEALLGLPALTARLVDGQQVLIVRGVGGRELLADTLRARGARVDYLEVYQRIATGADIAAAIAAGGGRPPQIAVLTSTEAIDELARLAGAQRQTWLLQLPLVVLSRRIATHALAAGFTGDLQVSPGADDAGVLAALVRFAAQAR